MNGYGHFARAAGSGSTSTGRFRRGLLLAPRHLLWVRGTDAGLARRAARRRRRASGGRCGWRSRPRLLGVRRHRRLHLLQHQRPQPATCPSDERRAAAGATTRRSTSSYEDVAAAAHHRGRGWTSTSIPSERAVDAARPLPAASTRPASRSSVLHVSLDPQRRASATLELPARHRVEHRRPELGYCDLPPRPAARARRGADLAFDARCRQPRLRQRRLATPRSSHNGTFFNNRDYFPHLGYDADARARRTATSAASTACRRSMRMAQARRPARRAATPTSPDADWIDFETTVSTSADQIALAPGYLQREWTEDGRRYFHYEMDAPILNFYAFLSARYAGEARPLERRARSRSTTTPRTPTTSTG